MANTIRFNATKRVANGSGEARRVRRAGGIPAALTRLDHTTETLRLDAHEFVMATRNEASDQILGELAIDGAPIHVIVREIQRDVIDGSPIHVDFSEIDMTRKIRANVRIVLVGEPDGVRNQGGVLTQMTHEVEVECLPAALVESIDVDVTELKLDETITVANLKFAEGIDVLTHADTPVAGVSAVKEEEEPAPAEEGAEPAAPEVLSKGKKEDPDAAAADAKDAKKK
jgi:large subunit ribosomal protein L25